VEKNLEKAFHIVLSHLLGDDYELRKWSLTALSRLRGQTAGEIIFERYQCDNLEGYLALAMNQADPERASQILVASLNDPQPEVRLQAAEALIVSQSDVAARVLSDAVENHIKALEGGKDTAVLVSEEALLSAVKALGGIGSASCIRTLRRLAPIEPSAKVRAKAIALLGKFANESMVPFFQGFLRDQDSRVRANAIESIDRVCSKGVVGILMSYLDDPHQRIRANAAKAIWKHGDFEVTQTIKEMLKSQDKPQRVSAIYLIGEIKHPDFMKTLLTFLQDSDPDIRRNAVTALRKLENPEHEKVLRPLLDDIDDEVRLQSLLAIVGLTGPKALPLLSERLKKDPSPIIRGSIVTELGKIGNEIILGDLLEAFSDQDPRVIANALEATAKIISANPPEKIMVRVRQLLLSESSRVRANAIRILWNWGVPSALGSLIQMLEAKDKKLKISGLHCLGEVFSSVSQGDGSHLKVFDEILRRVIKHFRQVISQKSSKAVESRVRECFTQINECLRQNQTGEALKLLQEILACDPQNVHALAMAGDLHFQEGRFDDAEQAFNNALTLQPNLGKALYTLGMIHHRRGQWAQARDKLLATLKINPKIPNAYLLLSEALENEGRINDSLQIMKRLFSMIPQNPGVAQRLCKLCFLAGQTREALKLAATLPAGKTDDPILQLLLALGEHLGHDPGAGFSRLMKLFREVTLNPHESKFSSLPAYLAKAEEIAAQTVAGPPSQIG
jgi:HEAT repeat protein